MSTEFSIRPVGAPAATPVVQSLSDAASNASVSVRNDPENASDFVSHQVVIDRAAASIVYQVVDNRTNLVVEQFPDEAVLRRRAYFRALDLTRDTPTRHIVTDRKA
jgi:hypothetical protein